MPALKLKKKSITSSVFKYLNLLAIAAATNLIWTSLASSFSPQQILTSAICGKDIALHECCKNGINKGIIKT